MEKLNNIIFIFLANACWQIPVITLIAFITCRLIKNAPARYEHLLWLMALLLSIILPLISLKTSMQSNILLANTIMTSWATSSTMQISADTNAAPIHITQHASHWVASIKDWFNYLTISTHISLLLVSAYLLSVSYQLMRLLRAWRKTTAIKNIAYARELPESIVSTLQKCRKELNVTNVTLLCSADIAGPLTLGAITPIIILPETLFNDASQEVLLSILGHELAHIKRNDYLYNLIYELLYLPIAFHPLTGFIKHRLAITRELACDEAVVTRFVDATVYADSILSIAQNVAITQTDKYSLGIFDAGNLEERIIKLVTKRQLGKKMGQLLLAISVLLLLVSGWTASAFSFNPPPDKVTIFMQLDNNGSITITKEISDDSLLAKPKMLELVTACAKTSIDLDLLHASPDAVSAELTKASGHNIRFANVIAHHQEMAINTAKVPLGDLLRFLSDHMGEPQIDGISFKEIDAATISIVESRFSISLSNVKREDVFHILTYFYGDSTIIAEADPDTKMTRTANNIYFHNMIEIMYEDNHTAHHFPEPQ